LTNIALLFVDATFEQCDLHAYKSEIGVTCTHWQMAAATHFSLHWISDFVVLLVEGFYYVQ
jgi:hypothetical protein